MAVFVPAAFMPGITGQMYRQFALVIAATALISAINAATLKPTQCALWLRPVPPGHTKDGFYRGFDAVYNPVERAYIRLIARMVEPQRQDLPGGSRADRCSATGRPHPRCRRGSYRSRTRATS